MTMNKIIWIGLLGLACTVTNAQVLRDYNFRHQYDPTALASIQWKIINEGASYSIFYEVTLTDSTGVDQLMVELEARESLTEKSGKVFHNPPTSPKAVWARGIAHLSAGPETNMVVAKITVTGKGKPNVFLFYKQLPKNQTQYLVANNRPVLKPYTQVNRLISLSGLNNEAAWVSYYTDIFPAAAPPFSTALSKVSKTIKADSLYTINPTAPLSFSKKGLYLVQRDTSVAEGLAFRIEDDYPKLGRLETLAGPLLYICTKQENEKLRLAGNDKKKFDQVILSITGNAERARNFMRSYFKRVELANQYFTSYKEGWKTDRGMIYIIFGLPEEVYLFDDREVWEYKNDQTKIRFQFAKSPSLFDPDNYVLIRDKKFNTPWLDMVDLWRKARF